MGHSRKSSSYQLLLTNQANYRTCLRCSRKFLSTHPGNRLCEACNERNRFLSIRAESITPSKVDDSIDQDVVVTLLSGEEFLGV